MNKLYNLFGVAVVILSIIGVTAILILSIIMIVILYGAL